MAQRARLWLATSGSNPMAQLPNRANARINRGLIGPLNNHCTNGKKGEGPVKPNFVTNLRDFWTNDSGLTSFETTFNVTGPNIVLEMNYIYEGEPVFSITHGGEPVQVVAEERHEAAGLGCLVAIASGLTTEVASLVIEATGGTFGGIAGRVRTLDYAPSVAWTSGINGRGSATYTLEGEVAGDLIGISAWDAGYKDSGKFAELGMVSRVEIISGAEQIPYTTTAIGEFWEELAPGVYHIDTAPDRPRPQPLFSFVFDKEYPSPLYWDFAASTNASITFTGVGNSTTNNNWVSGSVSAPVIGANVTQNQHLYNSTYSGATLSAYGDTTVGSFKFYSNPLVRFSGIYTGQGVSMTTYRNNGGGNWAALAVCLVPA